MDKIAMKTEGYSGADMKNLTQEACMEAVRSEVRKNGGNVVGIDADDLRPVVIKDFQLAAKVQKPTVRLDEIERYEEYDKKHGANLLENTNANSDDEW